MQPTGLHGNGIIRDTISQNVIRQVGHDTEAIRFDTFDPDGFPERDSPDTYNCPPVTRDGLLVCFEGETIETVFVTSFPFRLNHVTIRVVEFGNNGVSHGNCLLFVFQHEREVYFIPRTPHAPFSINETFYSLLHDFATDVKVAV